MPSEKSRIKDRMAFTLRGPGGEIKQASNPLKAAAGVWQKSGGDLLRHDEGVLVPRLNIKGWVHARLWRDGKLIQVHSHHNTITVAMDAHVADQMSDSGDAAIGWMAVGTGSGQTSVSTGLATSLDRNALTSTTQGTGANDNDVIYVGDWAAGDGTGTITEAGIFLSDNNTTMMAYDDSMSISKGASDTLQITWTITFGAS